MIDVIDDGGERDASRRWRGLAANPSGYEHPGIEHAADDRATLDQLSNLIVGELPIVRDESAAIRVARPDRSVEMIERIAQAFVAEVRHVKDDPEPLHLLDQFSSLCAEIASRVRAVGVSPRPVVGRADRAESLRVRTLEMLRRQDRVSAFETQDVADRL